MLTLLTLLSVVTLSLANCNDYMLECLFTKYNGSQWVMSMEESCLMDNPVDSNTTFPCYRFDNDLYNGTFISEGCNLKWNCQQVGNVIGAGNEKVEHPHDFPLIIIVGTTFAVMMAMLE